MLLFLLSLCMVIKSIFSSDCQVSEWTAWSQCYGTCAYSIQIRNRDVIYPSLPDFPNYSENQVTILQPCPELYSMQSCELDFCTQTTPKSAPASTVSRDLLSPSTITPESLNLMEEELNKGSLDPNQVMRILQDKQQNQQTAYGDEINQPTIIRESTGGFGLQYPEFRSSTPAQTTTAKPHGYWNRLTIDFHDELHRPEPARPYRDSDSNPHQLQAYNPRLSQRAFRKNRRHFKSLYKAMNSKKRKMSNKQIQEEKMIEEKTENGFANAVTRELVPLPSPILRPQPPMARKPKMTEEDPDPELLTTDSPSFKQEEKESDQLDEPTLPTTSSKFIYHLPYDQSQAETSIDEPRGTWQRNTDYIPNTKRHASEITDMLYLSREILQQLTADSTLAPQQLNGDCDHNPRCCKIDRTICPDGTPVYYTKRYYREMGSPTCTLYDYPACDSNLERLERPILFEQNCQDLCFDDPHRHIDPLYQLRDE